MTKSLWMIAAALAFAAMGACVKLAADDGVAISKIIFFRCLLSLLPYYVYMRWRRIPVATPHWKAHLGRSVFSVSGLVTYFTAISLLPLATAVTLNYTSPLFVALILMVLARGHVRPATLLSLALGLSGVVLLLQPSFRAEYQLGAALALASAVCAASAMVTMRWLGDVGESPWRTVFYFTLYSTVFISPWFLLNDPLAPLTPKQITLLCAVGLFATLGQVMLTIAYQEGDPLLAAALGYTQVIFSAMLGIWLWGDHIAPVAGAGMLAIIASGVLTAFVQHRNRKKLAGQ